MTDAGIFEDTWDDGPSIPVCSSDCCFNRTCPTRVQQRRTERTTDVDTCRIRQMLVGLMRKEFGSTTPIPVSADALEKLLKRRIERQPW